MQEETVENCRIESTSLGMERGFSITFWITLSGAGWGQSLGGYHLGSIEKGGFAPGLVAIAQILDVVGVESWEQLPGQLIRAKTFGLGSNKPPIIGNIIKDKWFDLAAFMEQNRQR